MATDRGFVKLFGKFRHWGWYTDSKAVHLFIHLLLCANYEPGKFLGKVIKRGQLATSLRSLSLATGLTEKEVRTRLKNFEKTGEILTESGNRFTLITICKYDNYNPPDDKRGKRTANEGQTKGKRRATIEEDKTIRLKEEREKHSPASLVENHPILDFINKETPILNTMEEPLTKDQADIIRRRYTRDGTEITFHNMKNKWSTVQNYKSTYSTFINWCEDKYKKPRA
jgi:hypothetical protein